jgi:hypothetical protein
MRDGEMSDVMESKHTNEQDHRRSSCELDDRYGEIGISAVAAAVRCRGEDRSAKRSRHLPHESD